MPDHLTHTIQAANVPVDLTDFPTLADTSDWYLVVGFASITENGGGSIRVHQGATELAREVVDYNSATGQGEVWFLIPFLSSSTDNVFTISSDGVSADYAVTDIYGRNAVWPDYGFVSHDGGLTDSTGNSSPINTGSTVANGRIGTGSEFNATNNSRISVASSSSIDDIFAGGGTLSFWANTHSTGQGGFGRLASKRGAGNNGWALFALNQTGFEYAFRADTSGTQGVWRAAFTTNTFQHVAVTYNSNSSTNEALIYVNASEIATQASDPTGTPDNDTGNTLIIGNNATFDREHDGVLDELRLRGDALSAPWISTEQSNQSNPGAFYTVTAVSGGTTVDASVAFGLNVGFTSAAEAVVSATVTEALSLGMQTTGQAVTGGEIDASVSYAVSLGAQAHAEAQANAAITMTTSLATQVVAEALVQAGITASIITGVTFDAFTVSGDAVTPEGRIYRVKAESRVMFIDAEDRTYSVH